MITQDLSTASLNEIKQVFKGLKPVSAQARVGFLRARFIGPIWLRHTAAPSLSLSGLSGWQGKRFLNNQQATNILKKKNALIEKMTMQCQDSVSTIDGKPSIALVYAKDAPIPWRWVTDELRQLDDNTWLCMTVFNLPLLKHFPMPFILAKES